MPSGVEAFAMYWLGVKLTDEEPLPGYLVARYSRHSNRPGCRCNREGKLHGPYYYRVWPEVIAYTLPAWNPKPVLKWHWEYVRLEHVRSVLARCRQYHIDSANTLLPRTLFDLYHGRHRLSSATARDLRRKWLV